MILEHFDEGRFRAAENMARDLSLLEDYPRPDALRLRHYAWEPDCFTFGYSQKFEWIRAQCPEGAQLARRPTGGGLVDHRSDWTFALAISAEHPFHHAPAIDVYRYVHEAIAKAFMALGRPATLQPEEAPSPALPGMPKRVRGLCFAGAEPCDVIDPAKRVKIAGAAMKRNRCGVLLQGSIDRLVAGEVDWTAFRALFVRNLSTRFGVTGVAEVEAPPYPADALAATMAKLASDTWLKRR
jgi:lipoate-protein ligase A